MRHGSLDLARVLEDLGRCGAQSVLVEGGARTFGTLLDAGMADRAALFVAGKLLGARGGTPHKASARWCRRRRQACHP